MNNESLETKPLIRCFLRKESGVGHYNPFADHGMSPKNYLLHFELCPMSGYANFVRPGGACKGRLGFFPNQLFRKWNEMFHI